MTIPLSTAGNVQPAERDYKLELHGAWPSSVPPPGWDESVDEGRRYLHRVVTWDRPSEDDRDFPTFEALGVSQVQFDEALLRFPSAPLYHTHRKQTYLFPLQRINYHTLRLIRPMRDAKVSKDIKRIYVLHNGLNEIDEMMFHYRMAAIITHLDENAACILRPFPGHLMRHPIGGPASERPLDRYLLDPGDLFRQFLRYMIETQWLFSILVPYHDYRVVDGLSLLSVGQRSDNSILSQEIFERWGSMFAVRGDGENRPPEQANGTPIELGAIEEVVGLLRSLTGFHSYTGSHDAPPSENVPVAPMLHTIGYSLGGFLAQAIFFTWPFAVGSCTTICSGGALRDVALTAFAHPEEWQTVIHAIRYEIETSMVERRIRYTDPELEKRKVCGIDVDEFSCFYQMFHDVFVREFGGSYRSRVSEFVTRLFFLIGGSDPIISASSVLDASPPEGINLMQVANLPHAPERGDVHWQAFWLPEATQLFSHFACRSERLLHDNLSRYWWNRERTALAKGSSAGKAIASGISLFRNRPSSRGYYDAGTGDDALNNEALQVELQTIADRFAGKTPSESGEGWLYIVRNEVPAALLGPLVLHLRGKSLHHSEEMIWSYFDCLRTREDQLKRAQDRLSLVIPKGWGDVFIQPQALFSPRPEAFMFRIPSEPTLRTVRAYFYYSWKDSAALRHFRPDTTIDPPRINTLPDVWVWWSPRALSAMARQGTRGRKAYEDGVVFQIEQMNRVKGREAREKDEWWNDFYGWLATDDVVIVKISRAEFNPRFRGWRVRDHGRAWTFLRHAVEAYKSSEPGREHEKLAEYQMLGPADPDGERSKRS